MGVTGTKGIVAGSGQVLTVPGADDLAPIVVAASDGTPRLPTGAATRLVQSGEPQRLELPPPLADGPMPRSVPYTAPHDLRARIAQALGVLEGRPTQWARDPHVVAALTYSDRFIGPAGRVAGSPLDRDAERGDIDKITIRAVVQAMGTRRGELRVAFFEAMRAAYNAQARDMPAAAVLPLRTFDYGQGFAHPDAIDLYVHREGDTANPIVSTSGGIVIMAEDGWSTDNRFATSSLRGGNTVTVYDPVRNEVHRYAHLQQVDARPLQVVRPGERLGLVGSTGSDSARGGGASERGHGRHLHYEIRYFPNGLAAESRSYLTEELRKRLGPEPR
ncbi:MAG TPA: M23 family metallopeptidase [Myxococcota bacterium]|nr:M23 family metallopeptidase [Myxococcota bacterium]